MKPVRNRIQEHVRIRAGDLVPHELNPRTHSSAQKRALRLLYDEIGFARSLLAYRLADGRLKLIDGHLRAGMNPDQIVDVEIVDVDDAEARALLLAMDPLAELAGYDRDVLAELRGIAENDSAAVKSLWQTLEEAAAATRRALDTHAPEMPAERYFVLIECEDEAAQRTLLARFDAEGLRCEAKVG